MQAKATFWYSSLVPNYSELPEMADGGGPEIHYVF